LFISSIHSIGFEDQIELKNDFSMNPDNYKMAPKKLPTVKSKKLFTLMKCPITQVDHVLIAIDGERIWTPLANCTMYKTRMNAIYYRLNTDDPIEPEVDETPPNENP
jgi:hypothetical protein